MPKKKNYEFDYEWNGNVQPQKGVNIKTKNPFAKPLFASVKQSSKPSSTVCSTPEQAPTDIDELRKSHPWQKPQWATVDKSPQKGNARHIDKDAIPKPMLKKTPGMEVGGGTNVIQADDDAIAAMERKLAAAKQRKAALQAQKQEQEIPAADTDDTRAKHTSEETKLERARRLAKERELERWRATLKERNERDAAKRAAAAALVSNVRDDTAWQTQKSPEQNSRTALELSDTIPKEPQSDRQDRGSKVAPIVETITISAPERHCTPSTTICPSPTSQPDTAEELARQIAKLELELQQYQ